MNLKWRLPIRNIVSKNNMVYKGSQSYFLQTVSTKEVGPYHTLKSRTSWSPSLRGGERSPWIFKSTVMWECCHCCRFCFAIAISPHIKTYLQSNVPTNETTPCFFVPFLQLKGKKDIGMTNILVPKASQRKRKLVILCYCYRNSSEKWA